MLFRRSHLTLSLTLAMLALTSAGAHAQDTGCPGKNYLETLKTTDAAAFARIRAAADTTPNGKNTLWKIEHPDFAEKPASYLFGTLGVTDPRLMKLSPATEGALSLSRRIAFEVEDLTADRTTEAIGVMTNALAPGASAKLDLVLGKPEVTRANLVLARSPLPKEWLPRAKAWVAMLAASRSECEASRLKQGRLTQDREIARIAEDRGVGSFGLESAEAQLGALAALSDADQIALLKARLGTYDQIDDRTEALVQLYRTRDIGALWPMQLELDKSAGVGAETLEAYRLAAIEERNVRMRDRLTMHLSYGGVFVAVGAIHLPGTRGLVDLLKDAGFTLTAME